MTQSLIVSDSEAGESIYSMPNSSGSYKDATSGTTTPDEPQRKQVKQGFVELVNNWKDAIKPWSEFLSISSFSLPLPVKHTLKRIKENVSYFPANYVAIILLLSFCCIITSFWLLISTIIIAMTFAFIRSKTSKGPLVVGGEEIPSWFLYSAVMFAIIPLLILADVGYILYCAVGTSLILILIHAIFYSGPSIKNSEGQKETPEIVIHQPTKSAESEQLLQSSGDVESDTLQNPHVRFAERKA